MSEARSLVNRVVVVQASAQGTGVLVTSRIILTAAHLLAGRGRRGDRRILVTHPNLSGWIPCDVEWSSSEQDIVLLSACAPVLPLAALGGRLRWGTVDTHQPLPHCQIMGFPHVQRERGTNAFRLDQYEATVLPVAGKPRPIVVCEFARPPVEEPAGGPSPLAGLSGAPVFAGGVLVGVVTDIPHGRGHHRAEAEPVDEVAHHLPRPRLAEPFDQSPRAVEKVTDFHRRDELFLSHYAAAVKRRYSKTEIIGIDELSHKESRWDLEPAYLLLRAEPAGLTRLDRNASAFGPQRIDELLAASSRVVLLRGEAGAGKTTLMWWLASHAVAGTLGQRLAFLNGLVPFIVPMRILRALAGGLPSPSRLASIARLMTDDPPEGWARRVLESGRGLLLIDGLDEVPQADREETRRWLTQLLEEFRGARCLITMRPLAVERDWLGLEEEVQEVRLLPMSDGDIQAFNRAWHNAAHQDPSCSPEERSRLTELESELAHQLSSTPALRDLARTPLLCAVICALHRRRGGLLPTSRPALYKAALTMLLGDRDALRRIDTPEGIELDTDEHMLLVQRIAAWLVRNGQSQLSHDQARRQLTHALRGMPRIATQGSAERILGHVLSRSGLLQERTGGSIQFIHRTFQEYLAAKELKESDHLGELLRHAGKEEWQDVVRLAVGQCSRGEISRVVGDLVRQGDATTGWDRWKLHLLAADCSLSAIYLDKTLRETVARRVAQLMPPSDTTESAALAKLGTYVLPLLPGPDELTEEQQILVLDTLNKIGTADCLPLISAFAQQPSAPVRQFVASSWRHHPHEPYADQVLARTRLNDVQLTIDRSELLPLVRRLPTLRRLELHAASWTRADLAVIPLLAGLRALHLAGLPGYGSTRLRPHPGVTHLYVNSPRFDVTDLNGWTGLRTLALWHPVPTTALFAQLVDLPGLRALQLPISAPVAALASVPPLIAVRTLVLPSLLETGDLRQLARVFPAMTSLTLRQEPSVFARHVDLRPLAALPNLKVRVIHAEERPPPVIGSEEFTGRLHVTRTPQTWWPQASD